MPDRVGGFHLEVNSIEEFMVLCALIRHEPVDEDKLKELVGRLRVASDQLDAATKANQ